MPPTAFPPTSSCASLYFFKIEDLPLQGFVDIQTQRQLKRCLQALRTALTAPSKAQAMIYLKTTVAIVQQLEHFTGTPPTISQGTATTWRLADQNNHLDIQTLQVNYPWQYLVINLVSAYRALLTHHVTADFNSPAIDGPRRGLLDCADFLTQALNLSQEVYR